jgi:twitching motility protein PilU
MRTFDWALFELYNEGLISYEEAIRNADSANELRLNIKLKSQRGEPAMAAGTVAVAAPGADAEEVEALRQEELRKQQEKRDALELERLAGGEDVLRRIASRHRLRKRPR